MPSKNGFGNSRTPLTRKAQYGVDQKNPIMKKTDEIKEHVLYKDPAISSVEHSKTTYSDKSGLQISGPGSKTGDVTKSGTSKTGTKTNVWKKSGKKRSAEWILNNPNG